MQSKFDQLVGKSFVYKGKTHKVLEIKDIYGKFAIKTDGPIFSKLESEYNDFLDEIDFRDITQFEEKAVYLPKSLAAQPQVHNAEIMKVNNLSARITDKLELLFDELSNDPSEQTLKKATAMINTSNAIVNIQMANLKFLNLK